MDVVAGVVAVGHDVARHDRHAAHRPDAAAVLPVAPRGMVLAVGEDPQRQRRGKQRRHEAQIADLDSREPEDLMSKRHEGWAERHEALEDLADDVMERLDELAEES